MDGRTDGQNRQMIAVTLRLHFVARVNNSYMNATTNTHYLKVDNFMKFKCQNHNLEKITYLSIKIKIIHLNVRTRY